MAPVIVFVGGFVRHDDLVHSEVQLAAHLRQDYFPEVDAEVFENDRRTEAYRKILRLLDTNRNGTLAIEEKLNARIVIHGHSWGASEAIALARQLAREGIPVLLSIAAKWSKALIAILAAPKATILWRWLWPSVAEL